MTESSLLNASSRLLTFASRKTCRNQKVRYGLHCSPVLQCRIEQRESRPTSPPFVVMAKPSNLNLDSFFTPTTCSTPMSTACPISVSFTGLTDSESDKSTDEREASFRESFPLTRLIVRKPRVEEKRMRDEVMTRSPGIPLRRAKKAGGSKGSAPKRTARMRYNSPPMGCSGSKARPSRVESALKVLLSSRDDRLTESEERLGVRPTFCSTTPHQLCATEDESDRTYRGREVTVQLTDVAACSCASFGHPLDRLPASKRSLLSAALLQHECSEFRIGRRAEKDPPVDIQDVS